MSQKETFSIDFETGDPNQRKLASLLRNQEFNRGTNTCVNQTYERLEKLGEGSYGVVYKAENRATGELVAIKKIRSDCTEEGISASTLREISMLKQLTHDCIVQLKHAGFQQNHMLLVFEFVELDLRRYLRRPEKLLPDLTRKRFMYQLVAGLDHCHKNRVFHRDIKPANLLIGPNDELKIADFGLGITHGIPVQQLSEPNEVVTLSYRAPELLLGTLRYTGAIDMWSVGCIFAEVYTKELLFDGDIEWEQLIEIFKKKGTPTDNEWPGVSKLECYSKTFPRWDKKKWSDIIQEKYGGDDLCWDFLERSLTYYPLKRMSAKDAMGHRIFDEIRQEFNEAARCGSKRELRPRPGKPRKKRKIS